MDDFPIVAVGPDWLLDEEPMGTKDKVWVCWPKDDRDEFWLLKFPRVNDGQGSTGEHWAEKVAAEICDQINLPHADVELADFEGRLGTLSREFPELREARTELVHGNELLSGFVDGYMPDVGRGQNLHTLENILNTVAAVVPKQRQNEAFELIGGFVVLDALILNTDRHHENWAMFRRTDEQGVTTHEMAPTFDHASSLGRELLEARLTVWNQEPDGSSGMRPMGMAAYI